jgi:hypothetical protein
MATLTDTATLTDLAQRLGVDLKNRAPALWKLSGFGEEYGLPLAGRSYARETKEMTDELTGILFGAAMLVRQPRQTMKGVGRPPNLLIPYLAPRLLSFYLRCHDSAGRKSVLTSISGQFAQMKAGPFFEFLKTSLEPLNQYLLEMNLKPISVAHLARLALAEHRELRVQSLGRRRRFNRFAGI